MQYFCHPTPQAPSFYPENSESPWMPQYEPWAMKPNNEGTNVPFESVLSPSFFKSVNI